VISVAAAAPAGMSESRPASAAVPVIAGGAA
jgi:hypothetical protein